MITRLNFDIQQVGKHLDEVPFNTTMAGLYDASILYKGYDPDKPETFEECYDTRVYKHFLETGKITEDPLESIARSLHDHFIRKGINSLVDCYAKTQVVGVMGGSAMRRDDEMFRRVALLSKQLTEAGSLMVSGGGPGAMEATSLGGMMAGRSVEDMDDVINIIKQAPCYNDTRYIEMAFRALQHYPQNTQYECLAIPTWLYGHEPTSPFASKIAKLFENSVREDTLLTIAYGGVIYAPGSAGTMQEIFQDAVQNHYLTLGISSPMVFLGKEYWTEQMPAYTMLSRLMYTGKYRNLLLHITDDPDEAVQIIKDFQDKQNDRTGNTGSC